MHLHSDEISLVLEFPSIADLLEGNQADEIKKSYIQHVKITLNHMFFFFQPFNDLQFLICK